MLELELLSFYFFCFFGFLGDSNLASYSKVFSWIFFIDAWLDFPTDFFYFFAEPTLFLLLLLDALEWEDFFLETEDFLSSTGSDS